MPAENDAKSPAAPSDCVEADFMAAIDRIIAGNPENKDLRKKMAREGVLTLDKRSVAMEAGHSRTTLYSFPAVVKRIEEMAKGPTSSARELVARLREENRLLRQELQQARDVAFAMLMNMKQMEEDKDVTVRRAIREAKRPDPNRIVGAPPLEGNVVPFAGRPEDGG